MDGWTRTRKSGEERQIQAGFEDWAYLCVTEQPNLSSVIKISSANGKREFSFPNLVTRRPSGLVGKLHTC